MEKRTYSGILVKCKNKVLLCKRNNLGSFPGMWSIPGGKLEMGENTKDGAKREFYEETNVDVSNEEMNFVGLIPRTTRDGKKVKGFMYVYLLQTDNEIIPDFENAIDGEEHTDYGYFDLKEIEPNKTGDYLYKLLEIILGKN